ncbi:hypothetical protein BCR44DRAFT_1430660 [Catenaria anguillulae PL171]|uniref:TFIIE alpha subunit-domain-containing protein n=1 Tax=Catenaria anguillulae PL171 TaxID=765915 RepID=A0A1Y2HRI9_9FUNG|nr:hypothetical protein BCR44DRAFT_1430660 [Catenaria anguillulae PL171]
MSNNPPPTLKNDASSTTNDPPPDLTNHKRLVKLTARTFFAPPEILYAFDIKDRDIHRMCSRLVDRRLLRREHRQKDKSAASRMAALFVDVLSFLLYELTGRVERTVSNEVEKRGYECPKCLRKYPLNDIGSRYVSDESLLANEPPELRILNNQIRPLLDLIEQCRDVPLPEYSRDEPIREEVVVELVDDADEEARRVKAAQQKKNQLPDWHRYSTVTGRPFQSMLEDEMEVDGEEHDEYYKDYLNQTLSGLGHKRSRSGDGSDADSDDEYGFEDALQPPAKRCAPIFRHRHCQSHGDCGHGSASGHGYGNGNGGGGGSDEDEFEFVDVASSVPVSGILVSVAGVQVPLEQIGDDERDRMTPEEYTQYYAVMNNGGGQ